MTPTIKGRRCSHCFILSRERGWFALDDSCSGLPVTKIENCRCPYCGRRVDFDPYHIDEVDCPHCGAACAVVATYELKKLSTNLNAQSRRPLDTASTAAAGFSSVVELKDKEVKD
jgi:hypothetical protein